MRKEFPALAEHTDDLKLGNRNKTRMPNKKDNTWNSTHVIKVIFQKNSNTQLAGCWVFEIEHRRFSQLGTG